MILVKLLEAKKKVILEKWFNRIMETYSEESANLLKQNKNPFANPMGQTFAHDIEVLYGILLKTEEKEDASSSLDNIIRIRAVQEFSPSDAISFIFLLKNVIQDEIKDEIQKNGLAKELHAFESRIDRLALEGFDIYMKCREKLFELRANEVKSRAYTLLKRANMICENTGS